MAETVESHTLEYLRRLDRKLDAVMDEQRALRNDYRRTAETLVGLARTIDHMREDLVAMLKAEISGLFAHLETRLEHRIDKEIETQLNPRSEP
jgi:hypothetical protein